MNVKRLTTLSILIGESEQNFFIIRKDDVKPISSRKAAKGYRYEMLGHNWPNKKWSAYLITYSQEASEENPGFSHDSYEFVYVLEGQMQFHFYDETYILSEGDCIFFDGSQPHGGRAYGGKPCRTLLILTPRI